VGEAIALYSRTPTDYANIIRGDFGPEARLGARYFAPSNASAPWPAIIIIPGSGGIGAHHLNQSEMLVEAGFAVLLVDPFSGRGIAETISDQGRLPFAAGAYDVLAAARYLQSRDDVDPRRMGVLGSSRGGTAALMASMPQLSEAVLGPGTVLSAVVAGYPWCGVQFRSGRVANGVRLLVLHGDRDDWVSVQQCQDLVHAAHVAGADAQMQIFPQAHHAFDREDIPPTRLDVATAPHLPTIYLDDDGAYFNWRTNARDERLSAQDFARYSVEGGFIEHGVTVGAGAPDQAANYRAAVLEFFVRTFAPSRVR
jgi:dienelactone hydrolase